MLMGDSAMWRGTNRVARILDPGAKRKRTALSIPLVLRAGQ